MGVESQVIFHNRFVSPEEMVEFIGAADIYITPYRHEAQVVSGTLAYALGAGKAIISTPYWHAIELLDDRRGALVPFENPDAIAQKTIELLDTPAIRHAMRKRAYLFAREMVWKRVAQGYMESFARVRSDRMASPKVQFSARITHKSLDQLPELKLNQSEPDDRRHRNATARDLHHPEPQRGLHHRRQCPRPHTCRAMLEQLALEQSGSGTLGQLSDDNHSLPFTNSPSLYLSFLEHAFSPAKGRFRNFSATIAGGTSRWARKTVTGGPCGHLERSWVDPVIRDSEGRGGALVRIFAPGGGGIQQSAGVGLHAARHSGISHFVSRRSRRAESAIRSQPPIARNV
jgi:hypothetical protein